MQLKVNKPAPKVPSTVEEVTTWDIFELQGSKAEFWEKLSRELQCHLLARMLSLGWVRKEICARLNIGLSTITHAFKRYNDLHGLPDEWRGYYAPKETIEDLHRDDGDLQEDSPAPQVIARNRGRVQKAFDQLIELVETVASPSITAHQADVLATLLGDYHQKLKEYHDKRERLYKNRDEA